MLNISKDTVCEPQYMIFDCDDDFCRFCIDPNIVLANNDINMGYDFNFTTSYLDAVNKGTKFIIRDENSQVYKHGEVSYRTITKPVQNLEQYFACLHDRD